MIDSQSGPVRIVPKEERTDLQIAIDDEEHNLPDIQRHYAVRAKQYRSFFEALVSESFTREEALKLTELEFLE